MRPDLLNFKMSIRTRRIPCYLLLSLTIIPHITGMATANLEMPLSNDFVVPTNAQIGATSRTDGGGVHLVAFFRNHLLKQLLRLKKASVHTCAETRLVFFPILHPSSFRKS
jgi:hypothetical protein